MCHHGPVVQTWREPLTAQRPSRADRIGDLLTGWVRLLPPALGGGLRRDLVGFLILGGFTALVDAALIAVFVGLLSMPTLLSLALAYVLAFSLNFVLNRTLNFKSHAPAGPQALRFAFVVIVDFMISVPGTALLHQATGVHLAISRLIAAACVATLTYTLSRWWVFRDHPQD